MAFPKRATVSILVVVFLSLISSRNVLASHSYARTCPNAESIIRDTINEHASRDPTIPAGLIRLHFHDCFVNGCDGSILLDSTPTDGTNVEKFAPPNRDSARGFEVIEDAKRRLEQACPGIVSCADTVAIAARDSTVKMGGQHYIVATGRYDGRVSSLQLATNIPSPSMDASTLIENFKNQGLSVQDLVVLSGAHTLGTSKCNFFASGRFDRLYNFRNTSRGDETVNPAYLQHLRNRCPREGSANTVELDKGSQFSFDNSYFKNLERRNGLLTSDQVLFESERTSGLVRSYAYNSRQFASHFGQSMVRMGSIGWKTKENGEIRTVCNAVNVNKHNML
ncbi:hypothetical protein SELMODRAFT_135010 [Selaginella moellendorffii]|uniref:Peroxidase n=1 Tax=Selaginella moellendorffii TaxID=88036 RepID=D8T9K5_SELML|nr:cationic peroxidase 2 [Selaginella moellendorffii]EFJ06665.1 hypothetical protein SELMODRAFT_135010 [Selaginella moellendorffii]|eukprot:XP_002992284.1 cationic peroxidase 2 [Selaginella moellendorffii]